MLQFNHISKRYGNGRHALHAVNFKLEPGEMAFLTGHSGAGKSTLLKLIARLESPTNGQILFQGNNILNFRGGEIPYWRQRLGMIWQDPHLLSDRTVFDNVALPLMIAGWRPQAIRGRVRAALDRVSLSKHENLLPQQLSSGEQQRVGIARAIVHKPALILADEPTGNLDPDLAKEIMAVFSQLNQTGVTVLVATHAIQTIRQLPHRVMVLRQGYLIDDHR